eukprot:16226848-Heterocapsa_arctica.AAC.1
MNKTSRSSQRSLAYEPSKTGGNSIDPSDRGCRTEEEHRSMHIGRETGWTKSSLRGSEANNTRSKGA